MRGLAICLFLASISASLSADYPVIKELSIHDLMFRQLQETIELFHSRDARGLSAPDLAVFRYQIAYETELMTLCARLALTYDTIATLNRIHEPVILKPGTIILVPSMPGIFVPETPTSDLELLMTNWRESRFAEARKIIVSQDGTNRAFMFFPGEKFHQAERAFFLNSMFRYPLPTARLTSGFGNRASPFSGQNQNHSGIDLAAPTGTEVCSVREGTVSETGFSEIYGNFILISHGGGWQSLYGHLASVDVRLNQSVKSGMIIGTVGSTGQSTGPHLHFELRNGGVPRNPEPLLPRRK